MATHSSILAWRIPWIEEPGGLQSMGYDDKSVVNKDQVLIDTEKKKKKTLRQTHEGDFPCSPVVKTLLLMQRVWVQSLIGKLRSQIAHSTAKK